VKPANTNISLYYILEATVIWNWRKYRLNSEGAILLLQGLNTGMTSREREVGEYWNWYLQERSCANKNK
jgi:hypothetical protein